MAFPNIIQKLLDITGMVRTAEANSRLAAQTAIKAKNDVDEVLAILDGLDDLSFLREVREKLDSLEDRVQYIESTGVTIELDEDEPEES